MAGKKQVRRINSVSGVSKKTKTITLRLPNDILETIERRAKNSHRWSPRQYLQRRIINDTRRRYKSF